MRRLEKPQPPENVSPDGQKPLPLVDAEQEFLEDLENRANKAQFARSEFNQLDKPKLRQVLYGEQGSICIYCERRLSEGGSPRVEHWCPVNAAPELALHWNNLYLSCSTRDTCDIRKGRRPLKAKDADPHLPWPTDFAYECLIGFTSAGYMYVRNDVDMDEATRKALELAIEDREDDGRLHRAILNLNHPTLREARREALDSERRRLERNFGQGVPSAVERAMHASQILDRDQLPDYVSIRVASLLETIGRGL